MDVHYDCAKQRPAAALSDRRNDDQRTRSRFPRYASSRAGPPWRTLPRIAASPGVTEVKAPSYAMPRTAADTHAEHRRSASSPLRSQKAQGATGIDGNGVSIMHADQFVAQTKTNGTGVTGRRAVDRRYQSRVIQGRGELPARRDRPDSERVRPALPSGMRARPCWKRSTPSLQGPASPSAVPPRSSNTSRASRNWSPPVRPCSSMTSSFPARMSCRPTVQTLRPSARS